MTSRPSRTCVISQPRFFPGLHYLHRLMVADVFVVLDTVQYNPRHEENRAKVKGPQGSHWLTVPMRRDSRSQLICDTVVGDQPWEDKTLRTLQHFYGKSPLYEETVDEVAEVVRHGHEQLVDLDLHSWQPVLRRLEADVEIVLASDLQVDGAGTDLLVNLCREVDATVYLSGGFGRDYLELDRFAAAGIDVGFHEYRYPEYQQNFGEFVPHLSSLDALFNVPLTREFVARGARER